MTRYAIEGSIKLTTPLHITSPVASKVDLDGKEQASGFPCTRTRKQFFADSDDKFPVALIPANTLRGKIRRHCAEAIHNALVARNETLTTSAYSMLQCGSATGNPDSAAATMAECISARHHPYMGLFGGGPRLLRSFMRVDPSYALTKATAAYMPYVNAEPHDGRLTEIVFIRKVDDILTFSHPDIQAKIIENYFDSVNAWQDGAAQTSQARKDAKDAEVNTAGDKKGMAKGVNTFVAKEYVIPGTRFGVRFEVDGNDEQLGLLLLGFNSMVREQRMGGNGQIGSGRFLLETLRLTNLDTGEVESLTQDSVSFTGEIVTAESETAMIFIDKANNWLSTVTSAEFERFAKSIEVKEPKSKKAKAEEMSDV